jgi:hypothetical protein
MQPRIRDWQRQMSPNEIVEFEAIAGATLDSLGYQRGAHKITRAQALRARMQRVRNEASWALNRRRTDFRLLRQRLRLPR